MGISEIIISNTQLFKVFLPSMYRDKIDKMTDLEKEVEMIKQGKVIIICVKVYLNI